MTGISKNILRVILLLSYIALTSFVIFGISSLYRYLNTGADRSSILHIDIKKADHYLPKVTWAPLNNEGRPMDEQTINNIERNYLDAWYVKHIAYKVNETMGIDDYYTENARKNIFNVIEQNTSRNITIDGTTLEHHPTLEFFSEDGQLVVLTDKKVVEYKRIYENENVILETTEKSNYSVTLLLEDGFWRIRHLIKQKTEVHIDKIDPSLNKLIGIKGINYYPQATPWDMFGEKFDVDIITKDFKLIKEIGLNSIRIFVPYQGFGKASINKEKLIKLTKVLDAAESNQLKVMITLFDFYGDYSVLDWTLNRRHAEIIVSALKNHNALLAWDIKNEPDLDFKSRGQDHVISWLDNMITLVKSVDQMHPVTIGWSKIESATVLKDKLDLISFHYYENLDDLEKKYKDLILEIPNKLITITEFGKSSYKGVWNPLGNSEKNQAEYHKQAQNIFNNNDMSFMSWTLYDFTEIPKEVVGRLPWHKNTQKKYGFINQKGKKKYAFKYIAKE